ncbi:MAG TPA: pitrilysin family protein [Polyangiaceae bacterium]
MRSPGGPRLVLVPLPHVHTAAIAVHVRVGSRFERAAENGISHFLEHMLHRGTPRHPSAHEQALAFERLGGTLSASTTVDHGMLGVSVPPENVEVALELLAEVCRSPVLDAIEVERGIVREEILEGLDARGRRVSPDDLLREASFPAHPLGRPIAGTLATLARFDERSLRRHHRAHYTTELVVTVAGNFDRRGVTRTALRAFRLPAGRTPRALSPRSLAGPRLSFVRESSSQTSLRLGFRAPGERDRDEPAVELMLRVLDDGTSTRLYHRLCDERGLCYDVSALFEAYEDVGLFDFAAECSHERAVVVLSEILAVVRDLRETGPRREELDKARERHRFQLAALQDSASDLAGFYGIGELTGVLRSPEERIARLERVSAEDVRAAAARVFQPRTLAAVVVGDVTASQRRALGRALDGLA